MRWKGPWHVEFLARLPDEWRRIEHIDGPPFATEAEAKAWVDSQTSGGKPVEFRVVGPVYEEEIQINPRRQ
jgi:hypothetical protein